MATRTRKTADLEDLPEDGLTVGTLKGQLTQTHDSVPVCIQVGNLVYKVRIDGIINGGRCRLIADSDAICVAIPHEVVNR